MPNTRRDLAHRYGCHGPRHAQTGYRGIDSELEKDGEKEYSSLQAEGAELLQEANEYLDLLKKS